MNNSQDNSTEVKRIMDTIIRVPSGVVWESLSSSIVFEYDKLEVYIQGFGHERLYLSRGSF